jgi:hypothetical protein
MRICTYAERFDHGETMKRLEEMNEHEFGGTGNIVKQDGDYWMFARVRKVDPEQDRALVDNYYRIHLMALAIKWNLAVGNILVFTVNTDIYDPDMVIPAAGTMFHDQGAHTPIELLSIGSANEQNNILL